MRYPECGKVLSDLQSDHTQGAMAKDRLSILALGSASAS